MIDSHELFKNSSLSNLRNASCILHILIYKYTGSGIRIMKQVSVLAVCCATSMLTCWYESNNYIYNIFIAGFQVKYTTQYTMTGSIYKVYT